MAVDTDTLFNQTAERKAEIESQRQNIASERQRLVQQEGSVSPRNRGQLRQLQDRISGLDSQMRHLDHGDNQDQKMLDMQLRTLHQATQSTIKLSNQSTLAQTIKETGNIAAGQMRLANQYGIGTPEYLNGMLALKDQNQLGWAAQASKGHLGPIAALHDKISDENRKSLQKTLFDAHQLSPAQFVARDVSRDRATNVPVLVDKNGKEDLKSGRPPTHDQVEAQRDAKGGTVAIDIGSRTYLFSKPLFDNLKATFDPQRPTNTSSTERPAGEVNYNVPATPPPKGTNYTFSGTETPNHPGDYWSEPQANGLVTHHFASGGSATVADHATPEGQALISDAQKQTAARKQFIDKNPGALSGFGAGDIGQHSGAGNMPLQSNIPANIPSAPPVEPTQPPAPAATNSNVLVQPYEMGDEKAGIKPSVQVNPSAATLPAGVQPNAPIKPTFTFSQGADLANKLATNPAQIALKGGQAAPPAAPPAGVAQQPVNTLNLPKVGDTREVGGVTHTWNGTRWDAP